MRNGKADLQRFNLGPPAKGAQNQMGHSTTWTLIELECSKDEARKYVHVSTELNFVQPAEAILSKIFIA
jgi:hypothetical protein